MTRKLQHWFALSEKGAKDLVKAVAWCFVCNLSLMVPIGVVLLTAQHLLDCLETGADPMGRFWVFAGAALAVLVLLFVLHWFQYASLYIATYRESASRRVSLAATLRKLPLSFFGTRALSDLTATMISDCSSLDLPPFFPLWSSASACSAVTGDWRLPCCGWCRWPCS